MLAAVAAFAFATALQAASPNAPSRILEQYQAERTTWFTRVWPFANTLFGLLAVIEFSWSAAVMLLERSDLQSWTAALIRKIMWIGAFYALLLYGRFWIPAIIDSFNQIGQTASGSGPLSPSDIFGRGLDIAGALLGSASESGFFTNPGTAIALVVAAALSALAFIAITVQFVVAMVESYIIVAAGFIFVGFGGSRWTAPYVERYIGLGVSNGVKIMLLYLLIGTGMDLSVGWLTDAQQVGTSSTPAMSAFEVMGAALIFTMLCWQIPKLFSAVLGGSPALTGGDLVTTATAVWAGVSALGSLGASTMATLGGPRAIASTTQAANPGSGGPGTMSGLIAAPANSAPANSVSPPPTQNPSGGTTSQPKPPSRFRGFGGGFMSGRLPSDAAPHATPPKLDIDHHE